MRSVVLVLGSAVLILACSSARPPIEASTGTLTSAEVARDDGWSRYQHAVELQRQGRVDVALVTYREPRSSSRRAATDTATRDYAHFVEPDDRRASTLALGYRNGMTSPSSRTRARRRASRTTASFARSLRTVAPERTPRSRAARKRSARTPSMRTSFEATRRGRPSSRKKSRGTA
jgi:hypothetical protein